MRARWRDPYDGDALRPPRRGSWTAATQRDVQLDVLRVARALDALLEPRRHGRARGQAGVGGRASACARSACSWTTSRWSCSTPRTGPPSPTWSRPTRPSSGPSRTGWARARSSPSARTVYWGRGDEAYIARLGAAIPGDVDLFWTGRAICSPTLDLDDARRFEATIGRAAALLGQLPRQRRRHDLRAAHRARTAAGTPPGRGARAGSSPTRWSCSRRRRSRWPRSRTTSATPPPTTPRPSWAAAILRGRRSGRRRGLRRVRGQRALVLPERGRRARRWTGPGGLRVPAGPRRGSGRGRGPGRARGPAAGRRPPPASRARGEHGARRRLPPLDRGVRARGAGHPHGSRDLAAEDRLDSDGPAELRPWLVALRQARVRVFGDALDMTLADLTNTHVRPGELTLADPAGGNR